jgi:hypothetical protein
MGMDSETRELLIPWRELSPGARARLLKSVTWLSRMMPAVTLMAINSGELTVLEAR